MRSAADVGTPRAIAALIRVQILQKLMKLSQGDTVTLYIWAAVSPKSGVSALLHSCYPHGYRFWSEGSGKKKTKTAAPTGAGG